MTMNEFKVEVVATKEVICDGKWPKQINTDDSIWTIERNGDKSTL